MSGNEILLNMRNADFFRNSELCNSLYELSRRVNLPTNKNVNVEYESHDYVKNAINNVLRKINNFNVNFFYFNILNRDIIFFSSNN